MSDKILTVSIAAYNMEAYLRQTLDSLMDEHIIDELEVFVVDDGSTDRTLEIAQEYAAKHPNSIFAVHKGNGGYGTTVNYSIAHATGKYFNLLDGDDWFNTEELVRLVMALREIQDDLVFLPLRRVYENGREEYVPAVSPRDNIRNGDRFILDEVGKTAETHAIVYRTEVLKHSGLMLPSHRLFTDGLYNSVPIAFCETSRYFDICVYCYRLGREGQSVERSTRYQSAMDLRKLIEDQLVFYNDAKKKKLRNLAYLERRYECEYVSCLTPYIYAPVSRKVLDQLKEYEKNVGLLSPEVSKLKHVHGRKIVFFIKICRKTNYAAYWLLKLVPGGFYMHNMRVPSGKVKGKIYRGGVAGNSYYNPVIAYCAGAAS